MGEHLDPTVVDSQHKKSGPGHHPQQRAENADRKPVPIDLTSHKPQKPVDVILNGSVDALVHSPPNSQIGQLHQHEAGRNEGKREE